MRLEILILAISTGKIRNPFKPFRRIKEKWNRQILRESHYKDNGSGIQIEKCPEKCSFSLREMRAEEIEKLGPLPKYLDRYKLRIQKSR